MNKQEIANRIQETEKTLADLREKLLKADQITDIKAGDLFKNKKDNGYFIIVEHGYTGYGDAKVYNIVGLDGGLSHYSNWKNGTTKENILEFINRFERVFVKNINEDLKKLCEETVRTFKKAA